jgi:hypothetical protein
MPNTYTPTNLQVKNTLGDKVNITWDFPSPGLQPLYTFNIYTSSSPVNPIVAAPTITGIPRASAGVINPTPPNNFYITVTSVDTNTTNESPQSTSLLVSTNHTATTLNAAIARSDSGVPKFIAATEDGNPVVTIKNAEFGPVTSASIGAGSSGTIDVRTGFTKQMLRLLEIRPTVSGGNNFDVAIYKNTGRTKQIYLTTGITLDQFVSEEDFAMSLDSETMYFTITNHAGGARTFVIEGTIEVRD